MILRRDPPSTSSSWASSTPQPRLFEEIAARLLCGKIEPASPREGQKVPGGAFNLGAGNEDGALRALLGARLLRPSLHFQRVPLSLDR
jgi:hypothetical protein